MQTFRKKTIQPYGSWNSSKFLIFQTLIPDLLKTMEPCLNFLCGTLHYLTVIKLWKKKTVLKTHFYIKHKSHFNPFVPRLSQNYLYQGNLSPTILSHRRPMLLGMLHRYPSDPLLTLHSPSKQFWSITKLRWYLLCPTTSHVILSWQR